MFHIDIIIDIPLMPDLPYRYPISISNIDIGSYLVTLITPLPGVAPHGRLVDPHHRVVAVDGTAEVQRRKLNCKANSESCLSSF